MQQERETRVQPLKRRFHDPLFVDLYFYFRYTARIYFSSPRPFISSRPRLSCALTRVSLLRVTCAIYERQLDREESLVDFRGSVLPAFTRTRV